MSIISDLRSQIGDAVRLHSIEKHRSRVGWQKASRYTAYLDRCRRDFDGELPDPGALRPAVADFVQNGVCSFQTEETKEIATAMFERIQAREAAGEPVWQEENMEVGQRNYAGDLWNDFPEIERLFQGPLGVFLESYFRTHFKILYGTLYRSLGSRPKPAGSQHWHSDSGPGICVNVMFYLHETEPEHGVLEALPWDDALSIYRREPKEVRRRARETANSNRRELMTAFYNDVIDREFADDIVQPYGRAGLLVPFLNNTLHRGGFPRSGRQRTAVVFHCYPSHEPTDYALYARKGIAKTLPYPEDPAAHF